MQRLLPAMLLAGLFLKQISSTHAAYLYGVTDLGTLGGATSSAYNVNNAGQVVGQADTATQTDAFLWSSSTGMVDLGTTGGNFGRGENINNSGVIVGISADSTGNQFAMSYNYPGGPMVNQNSNIQVSPLSNGSSIYTVTDGGKMVGFTLVPGQVSRYFDGTSWTSLPTLGGSGNGNFARSVNDSGQVVGRARTVSGNLDAYLWTSGGGIVDLGTLGGSGSQANYINASGLIVGSSAIASGQQNAYYDNNGSSMVDIGTLGGATSSALKDNSLGDIVGTSLNSGGSSRAFIYTGGVMYDLNTLTDSSGVGWTLQAAQGISDTGYIVGVGVNPSGQTHAFLLTITPEPESILLVMGGLGLLGLVVRRKY